MLAFPPMSKKSTSRKRHTHHRQKRPSRPREPLHVLMRYEISAQGAARQELEPLKVTHEASLFLYDVLIGTTGSSEDWDTLRGRQKIAVGMLSTIMLRSARACMSVIGFGYVPEAIALKRRITEAAWRTEKVRNDPSGEYARKWVKGESSTRKLAQLGDEKLWEIYSAGSHADARLLPVDFRTEDGGELLRIRLTPERDSSMANQILTELATELLDQAAIVAMWVRSLPFTETEQARFDRINADVAIQLDKWYSGASESVDRRSV
jgi:hypothetical protein